MENKINIVELLKDCPSGMELDCTIFENLELDHIEKDDKTYPIICRVKTEWGYYNTHSFTEYGCYSTEKYSKCVIFPKGKTTWEGFVPPCKFKDGDIVVTKTSSNFIFYSIFQGIENREVLTYMDYYLDGNRLINVSPTLCYTYEIIEQRFATEEEKQKLFDAIKSNGYKWNEETKTLEKLVEPKFKVGDRIKEKQSNIIGEIIDVQKNKYNVRIDDKGLYLYFREQDNWELGPNKFDISTLKPFDKVLVRFNSLDCWHIQYFEKYDKGEQKYHFICLCECKYEQCIPYEENKHLLNTTNDCDNYYKTWE